MSSQSDAGRGLGRLLRAPATVTTRLCQAGILILAVWWVFGPLGGVGTTPRDLGEGANDTGPIFNWHPLLMLLAFPVLMGEALLAYRSPAPTLDSRPARKVYHISLQICALALALLGLTAAVRSHTLKLPQPIPNFYSAHSFLGGLVLALFAFQVALGLWAYAWPKLSHPARVILGPIHTFLGRAILGLGLAAAAVGLQEKATFLQLGAGAGPASAALRLPALLQLLLAAVALGVLWHHVEPARPGPGVVSLAGDGIPLFEQRTPRNSADH
ncbi:hypothetical protein ACKKBG_A09040 [Auxenochlorella protothecoides x Auxenochlorella symbiontica]